MREINLLTPRHRSRLLRSTVRRRFMVLYAVCILCLGGTWGALEAQTLRRQAVADALRAKAETVLSAEHQAAQLDIQADVLVARLAQYQATALPIETHRVLSEIAALLPQGMSLLKLDLKVEQVSVSKSVMEDLKEKVSKSRGKTPAAKPQRRVLTCTMEGLAPSDHDVFDFSQRLEEHSLFQQVLTDAQPSDAPGISHFTLSFQIDLETRYLFAEAPTEPVGGSQ